ncbi:MAG: FAD-dependent oxidoreductase [Candidatus Sungbacteria bacterium]|nr:FAD-dependent oxidoreductase [Candidatus Sungbacteria bacterium]
MRYDYLIIGGGIAGVTAAETIREEDAQATIALVSEETHPLYSRVMLPRYLKRKIQREQLFLRTEHQFTQKSIDLRLAQEVSFVDTKRGEIGLVNRAILGFKKLLIASGGRVKSIPENLRGEFSYRLQTLEDADRLFKNLYKITSPIVVGSSLISLELLEIFAVHKTPPVVLVRGPHFFREFLDASGAEILHANFRAHGIDAQYNTTVTSAEPKDNMLKVLTSRYSEIICDAMAFGIGIERNIGFLHGSGIECGKAGVKTNEFLETNAEGVFAAGDVAEFQDVISGKQHVVGTWTNAFLQGKCAGLNMVGKREIFKRVSSYSITNLGFHITILGECDGEGVEDIIRIDSAHRQYERFFLKDGIICGTALINRFPDKPILAKLIETRTPVGEYAEQLRDFRFDIGSIPVIQ